jgi:hypothetical protein
MGLSQRPPGEGCTIVNGVLRNVDYDILRHVTCSPAIEATLTLLKMGRVNDELVEMMRAVAIAWGNWLVYGNRWEYREREFHRANYALSDLVSIHRITGHPMWIALAHAHFWRFWGPHHRRQVLGPSGCKMHTYDTGWPWEERGNNMGHCHMWPWYHGEMVEGFYRFWQYAEPAAKAHMQQVVMDLSEWYVARESGPLMDTQDLRHVYNVMLHGGFVSDNPGEYPWLANTRENLSPQTWIALPGNATYKPLVFTEWHYWPGDYQERERTGPDNRTYPIEQHHDDGPKLYKNSGWGVANLLAARAIITGKTEDWRWAGWATHDYFGFANHTAIQDLARKDRPNVRPTSGAQGTGRGGQWLMKCAWRTRGRFINSGVG